ncbi:transcriptional regulator, partial [Bifidobacteriaceae bacterium NR003]
MPIYLIDKLDAKSAAIKTQQEASMLMRETVRILR